MPSNGALSRERKTKKAQTVLRHPLSLEVAAGLIMDKVAVVLAATGTDFRRPRAEALEVAAEADEVVLVAGVALVAAGSATLRMALTPSIPALARDLAH